MMLIIPVCVSDVILRFFPHLKKQRFDFVLKFPTFSWHFVDLLKFIIEKNTDQRLGQGKYCFFYDIIKLICCKE